MARMTNINQERELAEFAEEASRYFSNNPHINTYTHSGFVEPDQLFAMRWGADKDCVLVFKTAEFFTPIIYQQAIKHKEVR